MGTLMGGVGVEAPILGGLIGAVQTGTAIAGGQWEDVAGGFIGGTLGYLAGSFILQGQQGSMDEPGVSERQQLGQELEEASPLVRSWRVSGF
jgi:hypothetical protein